MRIVRSVPRPVPHLSFRPIASKSSVSETPLKLECTFPRLVHYPRAGSLLQRKLTFGAFSAKTPISLLCGVRLPVLHQPQVVLKLLGNVVIKQYTGCPQGRCFGGPKEPPSLGFYWVRQIPQWSPHCCYCLRRFECWPHAPAPDAGPPVQHPSAKLVAPGPHMPRRSLPGPQMPRHSPCGTQPSEGAWVGVELRLSAMSIRPKKHKEVYRREGGKKNRLGGWAMRAGGMRRG